MKHNILLVEDDPYVGELYSIMLEQNGYHVKLATNGCAALDILDNYNPDLIISDVDMPEMNGYEFRKRILNSSSWQYIPFLFSSTRSVNTNQLNTLRLTHNDLISKRNGPKYFINKINQLLT